MTAEDILGIVGERGLSASLDPAGCVVLRGPEEEKTEALLEAVLVFHADLVAHLREHPEQQKGPARRRVVLVGAGGTAEAVLAETTPEETLPELRRQHERNGGRAVAAEWLGPYGWSRFITKAVIYLTHHG